MPDKITEKINSCATFDSLNVRSLNLNSLLYLFVLDKSQILKYSNKIKLQYFQRPYVLNTYENKLITSVNQEN